MKKIVFLDRSLFMCERISQELRKKGCTTFLLLHQFVRYDKQCFDKVVYMPKYAQNQKLYPIDNTELLNCGILQFEYKKICKNETITNKELIIIRKHMSYIESFFKKFKVDVVFIYNGTTVVEKIVSIIAKSLNVKLIFIEEGYFRPFTVSLDTQGITADNSVPRSREFYESVQLDDYLFQNFIKKPMQLDHVKTEYESLVRKLFNKGKYRIINRFLSYIGFQIKSDHLINYKYTWFKITNSFRKQKIEPLKIPTKYIFVPLQVHSDSQVLLQSPNVSSMEQLIEIVTQAVATYNEKYNENYSVIFKEHPKDYVEYRRRYGKKIFGCKTVFVRNYSTQQLIINAAAVVTINSTVAIESLMFHKKVVSLGNAFYNIEGIVEHCSDPARLTSILRKVIHRPVNKDLISKFLYYLRFEYNIEGYLNSRDEETCKNISNKVIKLL